MTFFFVRNMMFPELKQLKRKVETEVKKILAWSEEKNAFVLVSVDACVESNKSLHKK